MNIKLPGLIAVAFVAATSFSALAASPVSAEQSQNLQAMGTVSVSGLNGSPDDATRQLKKKAEDAGASHYRIIGVDNPGDSSRWSGTAQIYR